MKKIIIAIVAVLALTSCSTEDVCGTVNGFDVDNCNEYGCTYYIYLDGEKVSVSRDIWNTTQYGEEICIGY